MAFVDIALGIIILQLACIAGAMVIMLRSEPKALYAKPEQTPLPVQDASSVPAMPHDHVRVIGPKGQHWASLPNTHHDLDEYRATPGFRLIHPDGTVEEGKQ